MKNKNISILPQHGKNVVLPQYRHGIRFYFHTSLIYTSYIYTKMITMILWGMTCYYNLKTPAITTVNVQKQGNNVVLRDFTHLFTFTRLTRFFCEMIEFILSGFSDFEFFTHDFCSKLPVSKLNFDTFHLTVSRSYWATATRVFGGAGRWRHWQVVQSNVILAIVKYLKYYMW